MGGSYRPPGGGVASAASRRRGFLPAPHPPHNEAPLADRERGSEPGALWADEPGCGLSRSLDGAVGIHSRLAGLPATKYPGGQPLPRRAATIHEGHTLPMKGTMSASGDWIHPNTCSPVPCCVSVSPANRPARQHTRKGGRCQLATPPLYQQPPRPPAVFLTTHEPRLTTTPRPPARTASTPNSRSGAYSSA
jgi:hypothetical protein